MRRAISRRSQKKVGGSREKGFVQSSTLSLRSESLSSSKIFNKSPLHNRAHKPKMLIWLNLAHDMRTTEAEDVETKRICKEKGIISHPRQRIFVAMAHRLDVAFEIRAHRCDTWRRKF